MKFNMETAYIPYTSIFEKKDMMHDWQNTSNRGAFLGYIAAALGVILGASCSHFGDFFEFSIYGYSVALVIGGVFCKKWKLFAYWLNIIAFIYCDTLAALHMGEMTTTPIAALVGINLVSIPMVYFCLRCIYNYTHVFKELKKSKGFPSFVVNSADLYADKMYLKDEEKENKKTPEFKAAPIVMNIDVNPTKQEIEARRKKKHKHHLAFWGIDIIFPHDDPQDMDFNDKKGYMFDWNSNVEFARNGIFIHILFMMAGTLFAVIGGGTSAIILGYGGILLLVLGTNYMKMGDLIGGFMTITAILMYAGIMFSVPWDGASVPVAVAFGLATSVYNIKILLPAIRFIINYPMYKELSTHEGFPSFVRTTADLYADQMYIIEKRAPVKTRRLTDDEKFHIDIGVNEKPKKEDKGWNAFDYMDEERE